MLVPTESTVIYGAKLKLIDVAYEIAQSRSMRKPEVQKLINQGTNIYLWLQAYNAAAYLSKNEREKIWLCLIDIADLNNFPVAPVIGQTDQPNVFVGQNSSTVNNITYQGGVPFVNADVDIGTEVVDSFNITLDYGVVWFYTVRKAGNQRSGIIQASWTADGSNVVWQHDSTSDIGDTTGVTMSVDFSGGLIRLKATATTNDWVVEGSRYLVFAIGDNTSSGGGGDDNIDGGTP